MSWIAAAAAEPFKYELKILFTALLMTLAGLTKGTRHDDDVTAVHDATVKNAVTLQVQRQTSA